jgi:molybdopterin/thiamine biosynthesis adenylyltransferase
LNVIKESKKLSTFFVTEGLTARVDRMNILTSFLKKANYGVDCLDKFDRTLQLTLLEVKAAVTYVEENLSKVRTPSRCANPFMSRSQLGNYRDGIIGPKA